MRDGGLTCKQIEIINALKGREKGELVKVVGIFDDGGRMVGYLKAIDLSMCENEQVISKLVQWRTMFSDAFFTKFNVTYERTGNWLKNTVIPDCSRILFLVCDFDNTVYGHFGIADLSKDGAELDNAIHGCQCGPGFIHVERSVIHFCFCSLNVQFVTARVFSNNIGAHMMHRNAGLHLKEIKALKKIQTDYDTRYVQVDDESESNTDLKVCHYYTDSREFYRKNGFLKNCRAIQYVNFQEEA